VATGTIPGAQAATELLSRVGGFIGGCGEAALAVVAHIQNGTPVSPSEVTSIIGDAISHGATAQASTPSELAATAPDLGVNLEGVPWQQALSQYAGSTPILLGVNNANAFGGADTGVGGHYITVVGKTANGYVVADPNTPQSLTGGFVTYTEKQIAASLPFSAQIPTAPPNPLGSLFGGATGGVASGASGNWWQQFLTGLGLGSVQDAAWRTGLLILAAILLIVGLVMLLASVGGGDENKSENIEIAQQAAKSAGGGAGGGAEVAAAAA
jgi:hypothetical protein